MSVAIHGGLMLWVLLALAAPKPFEAMPEQAITVDVVTPEEAAQAGKGQSDKQAEKPPEKGSPAQAADSPPPAGALAMTQPPVQPAPPSGLSAFDPSMMALYNLRPETGGRGFDAKADQAAQLKREEIVAFRAQLRKCWRHPQGLPRSSSARVVLRASLTRDGALVGEPMLVEATASEDGPVVYRAAMAALTQCAPYRSLPRDRYKEWKVLDVSFSPREMSGG